MDVKVYRDGCIYHDAYEKGLPVIPLENGLLPVIGKTRETGTPDQLPARRRDL